MTLINMLRYESGAWFFPFLMSVALSIGMLFKQALANELYCFAVCAISGAAVVLDWYFAGNHVYIVFYWTLALFLSCFAANRMEVLRQSARWILGCMFLFAFTWKLLSPDFHSGAFMRYMLINSETLGQVGVLLGGLSWDQLNQNLGRTALLFHSPADAASVILSTTPRMAVLADFLSIATIFTEGLAALVLLVPLRPRWEFLRPGAVMFFLLTAYTVVSVGPFATQLAYLGYAMSRSNAGRAFFIAAFLVYQLADMRYFRVWGN